MLFEDNVHSGNIVKLAECLLFTIFPHATEGHTTSIQSTLVYQRSARQTFLEHLHHASSTAYRGAHMHELRIFMSMIHH